MNIVDARIFSSSSDFTLDTFLILDANNEPIQNQEIIDQLKLKLQDEIRDRDTATKPLAVNLPRQAKHFKLPLASILKSMRRLNAACSPSPPTIAPACSHTLRQPIQCEVQIQNARIATYGERAEDIFIITDVHNQPVKDEEQIACINEKILELLED